MGKWKMTIGFFLSAPLGFVRVDFQECGLSQRKFLSPVFQSNRPVLDRKIQGRKIRMNNGVFVCAKKLGKGESDVRALRKPFVGILRVTNPVW